MRAPFRPILLLLTLSAVLLAGCDSGPEAGAGQFVADIRGAFVAQLDGSARLILQPDADAPTAFDIILTAQRSEIAIRSTDDSGPPEAATYAVERAATDAAPTVSVEFDPDRFSTTSERFIAQSGTVTLTNVTDALVEGTFNLEAMGTNDATRDLVLVGEFTAPR